MEKIFITNHTPGSNGPIVIKVEKTNNVSDGYHTFGQLYDHRITLYIALAKKMASDVWRSVHHSDGSMYEGWFILGINKEKGKQITYHIPMERWEETDFAENLPMAPEWDGHTSEDVLNRIKNI